MFFIMSIVGSSGSKIISMAKIYTEKRNIQKNNFMKSHGKALSDEFPLILVI